MVRIAPRPLILFMVTIVLVLPVSSPAWGYEDEADPEADQRHREEG
jgi:hypothetical protein